MVYFISRLVYSVFKSLKYRELNTCQLEKISYKILCLSVSKRSGITTIQFYQTKHLHNMHKVFEELLAHQTYFLINFHSDIYSFWLLIVLLVILNQYIFLFSLFPIVLLINSIITILKTKNQNRPK